MRRDASESDAEIGLYPNPASQEINVAGLKVLTGYEVNVCNSLGIVVKTERIRTDLTGSFTMPVADLPMGIYCICAENQEESMMVKFVKL